MHLLVIGLALAVVVHDFHAASAEGFVVELPGWALGVMAVLPEALGLMLMWRLTSGTTRRLGQPSGRRWLMWHSRARVFWPTVLLGLFGLKLWLGVLATLRHTIGDWVLLDELIVMSPTLLAVGLGWAAVYPVERRLRDAEILRRLDSGLPIYPIWTRRQYVSAQFRFQVAVILMPLLLLMAWGESVVFMQLYGWMGETVAAWSAPIGAAVILLLSPPLLALVWDTAELPAGEVRDRLEAMCERHGVRVRRLLLWRTHGGMINAAVVGFIPPLRYVLLSDALLEQVEPREIEAVMAHELAHVKHRHPVWLLGAAVVMLAGAQVLLGAGLVRAGYDTTSGNAFTLVLVLSIALWLAGFGWVSRRFERQADTFAARHMSEVLEVSPGGLDAADAASPRGDGPGRFTTQGVSAMAGALQRVADLNHIRPTRWEWRHGSIAQRQRNLRALEGRPAKGPLVDRLVGWIKVATAVGFAAVIVWAATG
ncbi:MAG: M48 family metallopeptidase [Planctomycetota bacterium]